MMGKCIELARGNGYSYGFLSIVSGWVADGLSFLFFSFPFFFRMLTIVFRAVVANLGLGVCWLVGKIKT